MWIRTLFRKMWSIRGIFYRLKCYIVPKNKFGHIDSTVFIDLPITFDNPSNVFLYDHAHISSGSYISTTNARFIMKKYSDASNNLTVRTGNHDMKIGRYFQTITEEEKSKDLDKDVVVNEDVWIGCNVTLLSGVEIGRGAIIGACACVTKSIPPYAIAGGVPAKVIKFKWNIKQILAHESKLYPKNERFTEEELQSIFNKYNIQ